MTETESQPQPAHATPTTRAVARPWARAAVVAIVVAAAWLLTGVRVTEVLRFVAYEAGFVLVPGVVVHAALAGRRTPTLLERLVVGYGLGLAIEIGAFTLTAALDVRGLLPACVLPVYLGAGLAFATGRRQRPSLSLPAAANRVGWLGAGLAAITVVWVVFGFFISNPLARTVDSVAYDQDLVWHLALSTEAKNRWPTEDPDIAGESFHYHTFAYRDMAAVSQVTGIPLDVVLLRLFPFAVLLALGGGVALVTRRLGGSDSTALLAAALALLGGELDVDVRRELAFSGGSLLVHLQSPSFFLGAVLFMPLLFALLEVLGLRDDEPDSSVRPGWRSLAVLAVLLAAVAGTKANVIPGLLAGLVLFAAADFALRRRLRRGVVEALALGAVIFGAIYLLMYRGGGNSREFDIVPLHFGRLLAGNHSDAVAALMTLPGLIVILAPLVGIAGLFAVRGWRLPPAQLLLACMFVPGLVLYMALAQPGGPEVYFVLYGFLAAVPLSAFGITAVLERVPVERAQLMRWLLMGVGVMAAAALIGAAALHERDGRTAFPAAITAFLLVGLAIAIALYIGARRFSVSDRRVGVVGMAIPLILFVSFVDYPLDTGWRLGSRWSRGAPAWHEAIPFRESGLTRDLRAGLLWVRDHTPKSSVIAVNNMFIQPGFSRYFYYAAFSERRTYIEGWDYSERGLRTQRGEPLPDDLQQRVRTSWSAALGDPQALDVLRADGVDYLVIDRRQGQYANVPNVNKVLKPSFTNRAVAVYPL